MSPSKEITPDVRKMNQYIRLHVGFKQKSWTQSLFMWAISARRDFHTRPTKPISPAHKSLDTF